MSNSYKFRARPAFPPGLNVFSRFGQPTLQKLTLDSLGQSFAGAVVRQLIEYTDGSYDIEMDLQRPTHPDALNEIVNVLVGAGFQVAEAEITEWTTSWIEGAIVGALGGGAVGGIVGSLAGLFLGALIGTEVGIIGGTMQRKVIRVIDANANWYTAGGWQFVVRPEVAPAVNPRMAY